MARKSVIEMYSTYNEVKPVVTESFIRALTLFRMALFGTAKKPVTHILQRKNLAQLYLI